MTDDNVTEDISLQSSVCNEARNSYWPTVYSAPRAFYDSVT